MAFDDRSASRARLEGTPYSCSMPEYPDVVVYIESLERKLNGQTLERIRLASPFLLRSVEPALTEFEGRQITGFERLGKRIAFAFEGELFLVLHLMISGRLRWKARGFDVPKKRGLAAFDFAHGTLLLTEASSRKRASLHAVRGRAALREHNPGGLEVFEATVEQFGQALQVENRTLKRALTNPRRLSGIGNAYSDEILQRAKLSPLKLTQRLTDAEIATLFEVTRTTLTEWTERLRADVGDEFPDKVTAFRPEMAVHGKFGEACPECGTTVQRISYASNETNYCPRCQTGGRLLADRALSKLLKDDWPKTVDEWENPSA